LVPDVFQIGTILGKPTKRSDKFFGEAYAVRLNFMTLMIDLAQICLRVEILTRFVGIPDLPCAKVDLLIAALSAFSANGFPFVPIHFQHPPTAK